MTLLHPQRNDPPPEAPVVTPDRSLRDMLGHYATGVTVVTTTDRTGNPVGLTVNSFTSVSLRPPMVLWCLNRGSSTRDAFEHSGHYAVNILARDQSGLATRFAGSGANRFSDVPWRLGVAGQPILEGVSAWLVCRMPGAAINAGDHVVLFGRVLAHRTHHADPLLFAHGRYRTLDD
ncbi:MAG TPA: flavin reductase family protein [Candidatus Stackebrandtia excrementipullorum]|nr:flavin reductase family protein [Candidatus Stackebrandtia excrementipullorum]